MFRSPLRIPTSIFVPLSTSLRRHQYSRFSLHPWLSPCCRYSSSCETSSSMTETFFNKYVTPESCKNVIPGSAQRHTNVLPYGMVGRANARRSIEGHFQNLTRGRDGNDLSSRMLMNLFLVISTPRQGKTLFLDVMANDPGIIASWKNPYPKRPHLRCEHCFVFNVSFNSQWNLETMTISDGADNNNLSVAECEYQIALRLIAAAANIRRPRGPEYSEFAGMLRRICEQMSLNQITELLQIHIVRVLNVEWDSTRWLFLYDEFTKLSDRVPDIPDKSAKSNPRQTLFSRVCAMIDDRNCVVISGFNRHEVSLSASGRGISDCELPPLDTAATRRPALVLSTIYFQLASTIAAAPYTVVFYYELIKSSPGVLGAVIESIIQAPLSERRSIDATMLLKLPIVAMLRSEKPNVEFILQWKAVQFVDPSSQISLSSDSSLTLLSDVVHMPSGLPTLSGPRESSSLYNVHVEPLFLAQTSHGHFYQEFLRLLMNYDVALADLSTTDKTLARSLVRNHFRAITGTTQTDELTSTIELFDNELSNHRQHKQQQQQQQHYHKGRHKLAAYFLEDAVAVGICYQKSLRRDLSRRFPQTIASSILRFFDDGLEAKDENKFRTVFSNSSALLAVIWVRSSSHQSETVHRHFTGQFPCNFEGQEVTVKETKMNGTGTLGKTTLKSIHHYFTAHHVLQPARPESNPLVDIIFHEEFVDSTGNPRLVQFWVDAKHSHERHGKIINDAGNPKKFVNNVVTALNNPLLRSEHCRIDHVVHVIISTVPKMEVEATLSDLFSNKKMGHPKTKKNSYRANLPTYTLYVVHPESYAFQNLVSQPIANSTPLLDQQLSNSWCQKLGTTQEFYRYRATTKYGLDSFIRNRSDFAVWRKNRLNDELISSIASCFSNVEELRTNVLSKACMISFSYAEDDFKNRHYCLQYVAQLPMGLILEKLNIVTPSDFQLAYAKLIPNFGFGLDPSEPISNTHIPAIDSLIAMSIKLESGDTSTVTFDLLCPSFIKRLMSHCLVIGELVDGNQKSSEMNNNNNNNDLWRNFFVDEFLTKWKRSLREVGDDQRNRGHGNDVESQNAFDVVSAFDVPALAGTIWNTRVQHWQAGASPTFADSYHHHLDHESFICCRALRHLAETDEETKLFVDMVDDLIREKIPKVVKNN